MAWFGSNWFAGAWYASNWFVGAATPVVTGGGGGLPPKYYTDLAAQNDFANSLRDQSIAAQNAAIMRHREEEERILILTLFSGFE